MIIIQDNGRVYIAESVYITTKDGQKDVGCVEENMPICRIPGTKALVAGVGDRWRPDVDRLRYRHIPFPKELTVPGLHRILPKIADAIDEIDGLKDGQIQTDLVFAKGSEAYTLLSGTTFSRVDGFDSIGWRDTEYRYALTIYADLPVVERIKATYRLVGRYIGADLFPVILWDTKSLKPIIIKEDN